MAIGNNSFTTNTNIRFGARELPDVWWNAQQITIPSINMSTIKQNSRAGAMATAAADTCDFSELNVAVILDKEWKVYDAVYDYFLEGLNVETGTFSNKKKFELWAEFVDGKGVTKKRFWFHSCRLESFEGIVIDTTAEDENQVLNISFSCMYYSHEDPRNASFLKYPPDRRPEEWDEPSPKQD